MTPKTRLDKVLQLRERAEETALADLARARATVDRAREQLSKAIDHARQDGRTAGPVDMWQVDELARRRALQMVRAAEGEVRKASDGESRALEGYLSAHVETETVRRVQGRRRTEILGEMDRKERRDIDELATLRFNHPSR